MVAQGMDGLPVAMQGMATLGQPAFAAAAAPPLGAPFRTLQPAATAPMQGAQLVSIQGAPAVQDGLYDTYAGGEQAGWQQKMRHRAPRRRWWRSGYKRMRARQHSGSLRRCSYLRPALRVYVCLTSDLWLPEEL